MTKIHFNVGAILVLISLTVVFNVLAEAQRDDRGKTLPLDIKNGLQLSIELKKLNFHVEDELTLKVILKNISQSPITIYKNFGWGRSSSFSLAISDERGKVVHARMLDDSMHGPVFPKEDFIAIQPSESIQQERVLGLRNKGIKRPGVYRIIVRYHSPVPREFAPEGLEIWAMENGVLQSKPVTFRVTQ